MPICKLRKDGDGMREGGGDQSEYGLNVVDQFPNTGRSVRLGMDTKSFYTFTFFLRFLQSTGRIKAKTAF